MLDKKLFVCVLFTHISCFRLQTLSPPPPQHTKGQINESSSIVSRKFGMTHFSSKAITKTFLAAFSYEDSSLSFCGDTFR